MNGLLIGIALNASVVGLNVGMLFAGNNVWFHVFLAVLYTGTTALTCLATSDRVKVLLKRP